MLYPTLVDLILNPQDEHHQQVIGALRELLEGKSGGCSAQVRANTESAESEFPPSGWKVEGGNFAYRLDGLTLGKGQPGFYPANPDASHRTYWTVLFPGIRGGSSPGRSIVAATLADAIAVVDERYPMPEWWFKVR